MGSDSHKTPGLSKIGHGPHYRMDFCMRSPDTAVTFDREPQLAKLRIDLETSTINAEQAGVEPADVILELLKRADALAMLAVEQGADLTKLESVQ
jgi:hypothetical protein